MKLTSKDFNNKEIMAKKYTCKGEGINPALIIEEIPSGAISLALILDDPDAMSGAFVHWVVFDIQVINKIKQDSSPGVEGLNDANKIGYIGPCPPKGTGVHRYFFKLYALDRKLNLKEGI